nr:hypothetical protein [Tanacetum cinerariifolium]
MYGYDYMKKIVLHRADLNEHVIAERNFKYLYPSDFEDSYLLNLQGHLNHLPPKDKKILITAVNQWTRHLVIRQRVEDFQLGIESYQTQLNLSKPQWDATGFEYKHDYSVIDSPRAVMFQDKYGVQMMMRFNEIHKFSDGTLHQINEALDYRVKEFRINRMNPVDIEKVAVCSSLRSLKPKCTIESKAKRSSKIISLGHYSIMLASSHTVKNGNPARANIKQALNRHALIHQNLVREVRFAKPITSSNNIPKQTDSLKTKDSNKLLLTSTRVKPTTSASGLKPSGNTKNNRITRPPLSNKKNKVEDHPRKVKSSLNKMNSVSKPISNALVKHSVRNAKFESTFAICNKCLFDADHDMCLVDFVNDVNLRSKSKAKRNKKRKA